MKQIKPNIGPEERIGQPKRSTITKAEIRIPLRIEDDRKDQSDDGSDHARGQFQNRGRHLDAEFRGKRRLAGHSVCAESSAVFRCETKIKREVQERESKSPAKQFPPDGQECPEDSGVAELPHPEPFLYPAGDERQDTDEQDRSDDDDFHWAPSPGALSQDGVVTSVCATLFVRKRP